MSERDLLASIRLAIGRDRDVALFRNSTGVATSTSGNVVRYGLCVGSSDLIGIVAPHGRFLALECKTTRGQLTPEQRSFLDAVNERGGVGRMVRTVAEAEKAVRDAKEART